MSTSGPNLWWGGTADKIIIDGVLCPAGEPESTGFAVRLAPTGENSGAVCGTIGTLFDIAAVDVREDFLSFCRSHKEQQSAVWVLYENIYRNIVLQRNAESKKKEEWELCKMIFHQGYTKLCTKGASVIEVRGSNLTVVVQSGEEITLTNGIKLPSIDGYRGVTLQHSFFCLFF